eukprot:Skav223174  [mRNA]  locus=scaffold2044:146794:147042:+ [translate_table: standard]
MTGHWKHRVNDGKVQPPGERFNDGKVDPLGCYWAGTLVRDATGLDFEPKAASLYRRQADGSVKLALPEVTISNGSWAVLRES